MNVEERKKMKSYPEEPLPQFSFSSSFILVAYSSTDSAEYI